MLKKYYLGGLFGRPYQKTISKHVWVRRWICIYIWSTNCIKKYWLKIRCRSMRYLVHSLCSSLLKTSSNSTIRKQCRKQIWLSLDRKGKQQSSIFIVQITSAFTTFWYINTRVQCLLTCCGRWHFRSLQSTDFHDAIADRPLDESSKVLWQTAVRAFALSLLSLRNQSLNTGSFNQPSWKYLWFLTLSFLLFIIIKTKRNRQTPLLLNTFQVL